ncbi:MAG: hypothetical protein A3F83_03935 [Candidatus Glassbacteria bacterium RIFCSPLOWO2_12_FULL_58_11]|uniref:Thiol:disulfide interchange protein DsbD N-terminal domain-containing protein n=1 Tax=Candidatus Glassbacteria bacterium RIFCSPLOWO2_12_FULL_58_11 TaxID=1817867 RepID=A0A1F5YN95_9BACT|nr:MAG: hypothetical protein A3F83_03935 [Candidatus Glassbacteria bacterium RIFCSPLOWO2_12_FULL_58_11]
MRERTGNIRLTLFWLLAAAAAGSAGPLTAVESRPQVEVKLLTDRTAVKAGEKFRIGVLFKISEGSHIYWQNPGDAGLAPEIKWVLPEGFSSGPLFWPLPRRMEEPGGLFVNAYTDEVLLFSWVQPPAVLKEGSLKVAAEANWLVCRRICVQESARPEIELAIGRPADASAGDSAVFQRYSALVPRGAGEHPDLRLESYWDGWTGDQRNVRLGIIALESADSLPEFEAQRREIQWFSYPSSSLTSENIHLNPEQSGNSRLVLHLLVRKLENNEPWPQLWGGVLTVRLVKSDQQVIDYALSFDFTDRDSVP